MPPPVFVELLAAHYSSLSLFYQYRVGTVSFSQYGNEDRPRFNIRQQRNHLLLPANFALSTASSHSIRHNSLICKYPGILFFLVLRSTSYSGESHSTRALSGKQGLGNSTGVAQCATYIVIPSLAGATSTEPVQSQASTALPSKTSTRYHACRSSSLSRNTCDRR